MGLGLQLYELDSDPERKEFLDDLFVFMQKRGECAPYSSFQFTEYLLSAYCVHVTLSHPPCGVPASQPRRTRVVYCQLVPYLAE